MSGLMAGWGRPGGEPPLFDFDTPGAWRAPLLDFGMGLLAASGPSAQPVSLGQALAMGAQQATAGADRREVRDARRTTAQAAMLRAQAEQAKVAQEAAGRAAARAAVLGGGGEAPAPVAPVGAGLVAEALPVAAPVGATLVPPPGPRGEPFWMNPALAAGAPAPAMSGRPGGAPPRAPGPLRSATDRPDDIGESARMRADLIASGAPPEAFAAVPNRQQPGNPAAVRATLAAVPSTAPAVGPSASPGGLLGQVPEAMRPGIAALAEIDPERAVATALQAIQAGQNGPTMTVRRPDGSEEIRDRGTGRVLATSAPPMRDAQVRDFQDPDGRVRSYVVNPDGTRGRAVGEAPVTGSPVAVQRLGPDGQPIPNSAELVRPGDAVGRAPADSREDRGPERTTALRREFQALPQVTAYSTIREQYRNLLASQPNDTRASDMNIVFAYAKMLDPASVVREGEQLAVARTGGLSDTVLGAINALNGGARLTPEVRAALIREARGRYDVSRDEYEAQAGYYGDLARAGGIDGAQVVRRVGRLDTAPAGGAPPVTPASAAAARSAADGRGPPVATPAASPVAPVAPVAPRVDAPPPSAVAPPAAAPVAVERPSRGYTAGDLRTADDARLTGMAAAPGLTEREARAIIAEINRRRAGAIR